MTPRAQCTPVVTAPMVTRDTRAPGDWPRWRPSGCWGPGQRCCCPSPPPPCPRCPPPSRASPWCSSRRTERKRGDSNNCPEVTTSLPRNFWGKIEFEQTWNAQRAFRPKLYSWCDQWENFRVELGKFLVRTQLLSHYVICMFTDYVLHLHKSTVCIFTVNLIKWTVNVTNPYKLSTVLILIQLCILL